MLNLYFQCSKHSIEYVSNLTDLTISDRNQFLTSMANVIRVSGQPSTPPICFHKFSIYKTAPADWCVSKYWPKPKSDLNLTKFPTKSRPKFDQNLTKIWPKIWQKSWPKFNRKYDRKSDQILSKKYDQKMTKNLTLIDKRF